MAADDGVCMLWTEARLKSVFTLALYSDGRFGTMDCRSTYYFMEILRRGLSLTNDQIKNLTLFEIEKILLHFNSSLKKFIAMPYPDHESVSFSNNRLITEELDYDTTELQNELHQLAASLTDEQQGVFNNILAAVEQKK